MNTRTGMLSLSMLVFLLTISIAAGAGTIFVSPTGSDANSGASWDSAKLTIQGAISAAAVGDQVWVAKGNYSESLTLTSNIQLYGGFLGTETSLSERPAFPRPIPDTNETTILGASATGTCSAARIDGFAVRYGGGIRCVQASLAIANNTLVGDLYAQPADGAGAIFCDDHSSPLISNNFVCNYSASQRGGGIRCKNHSSPTIVNNSITGCLSQAGNGGGISCEDYSSPVIANNIIGGNMALNGGGIYCVSVSVPTITGNTITGNSGSAGAGIYCAATSPSISNNIIAFNSSGIAVVGGAPVKKNNCVYNPDGANYTGVSAGTGDISTDPMLVSVQHGEVHLQPGSPCINAGCDTSVQSGWVDMDALARIAGAHVDIGADEADGVERTYQPLVRYVSPTGADGSAGTSWQTAKQNLYAAMLALMPRGGEVWAQAGAYTRSVTLAPYCCLYGGFAGTETVISRRNPAQNVSQIAPSSPPSALTGVSTFSGNHISALDGFTVTGWGSGVSCLYASPAICNNVIYDNSSTGVFCSHSVATITDNKISGNHGYISGTSGRGGGIYCLYSPVSILRNTISGNTATGSWTSGGGGIYCANCSPLIQSNVIAGNAAQNGPVTTCGGGIYCDVGTSPTIVNNTIVDNTVSGSTSLLGGGIYLAGTPLLVNNIIAYNTSGLYGASGCAPVLSYNCVYNPSGADYNGVSEGTGDISSDPLFACKANGDYHLVYGSPCVNAGDNSIVDTGATDIDREPRITYLLVDIGADEVCLPSVVLHVAGNGNNSNDGLTWATAKSSIDAALSAAKPHDQVWVAKGSYYLGTSLTLKKDVELYGGFAGTENALNERPAFPRPAVDSNETSISPNVAAIVICPSGANAWTRLDGFTIWAGYYSNGYSQKGGVISCVGSSPVICNNTMIGTLQPGWEYGGAIYCSCASPLITGNTIIQFQAIYGGAICCDNQSSPTISNNIITRNRAGSDYDHNGLQTWTPGNGGAILCMNQSSPTIIDNVLGGNSAYLGGAVYARGCSPVIVNNTVTGNYAASGGAFYFDGSSSTLANNIVAFNSSGVSTSAAGPILRNNCVYNPDGANYTGLSAGEGDISLDPKLVAVEFGKVHVQPGSPCIDAGNDASVHSGSKDMDGSARVTGARVDIGADESDGTLWDPTPAVIRVKPDGNDSNDGSSWDKAMRSPMWAGTCLRYGGEMWVAAGSYDQFSISQIAKSYVYMYGGFSDSETSREQRDAKSHPTLLFPAYGLPAAPGYRVSRTDGFTITSYYVGYAAVDCRFSGAIITNNTLKGICCEYSAPVISNNTITGGKGIVATYLKGGGIYCDHTDGEISDNVISANSAQYGGGIACYYSSPAITGNTITGNSASSKGGGVYCSYSSPLIDSNIVTANTLGGGVCLEYPSSSIVKNNLITANKGAYPGLYCNQSSPAISYNIITANTSGGIAFVTGCPPAIRGNVITGNSTYGAKLQMSGPAVFIDNTVAGNATYGLWYAPTSPGTSLFAANNIVAFNAKGVSASTTFGPVTLQNNDVYNPTGTNYEGIQAGTGDICADPLFVDRSNGDYHLRIISPCVNAGRNTVAGLPETDIDGEGRIIYNTVDIGADECALKATRTRDTKLAPDGWAVDIRSAIVSAAFPDAFYIESDGRETGIRVEKTSNGLSAGQRADVQGTLTNNGKGERCIQATSASANGSGSVMPLTMNQLALGGGKCGYQDAICRWNTINIGDAFSRVWGPVAGINNIGLLVRVFGKVTTAGRAWFYIDDGSGVEDRSGIKGVYVDATGLQVPPAGSFVSVTGISSCETYLGSPVNTLLPRTDSDIVVLRQAEGSSEITPDNPRHLGS